MTAEADLIDAIRLQDAARVAADMAETESGDLAALGGAVVSACAGISQRMRDLRAEVLVACSRAGVAAEAVTGPEDTGALQFHLTAIRVAAADVAQVLEVASGFGFRAPFVPSRTQLTAMSRYLERITLVRDDAETVRLVLHLSGAQRGMPAMFVPKMADITAWNAAPGLSRAYPLIRLGRVVRDRMRGRRAAQSDNDFIGTPGGLVAPLLDLLEPKPEDVLFDLGCGDGRIVVAAARRYGCRAVGVESNPALVAQARKRVAALDPETRGRIEIREGFAEDADLSSASIVFLFVPSFLLAGLFDRVAAQAAAGTRVVVHEQARIKGLPPPHLRKVVVAPEAMTVAHVWHL